MTLSPPEILSIVAIMLSPYTEVGMAWGSAVTFFGAGVLALVVPQLIHAIGTTALLGLFA